MFDYSVKEDLSNLLQRTNVFQFDEKLKRQFKLACVVQDRFHDAMEYLDAHLDAPKTDQEFYLALVYADNVFSAVKEVFSVFKDDVADPFGVGGDFHECRKYFADVIKMAYREWDEEAGEYKYLPDDKVPTDDEFFRYFRALSFAHPYNTSVNKNKKRREQRKFMDEGEIQYSPFVLHSGHLLDSKSGLIGVKVYSTVFKRGDFEIVLPYALLKEFVVSRYETLRGVNDYLYRLIEAKRVEWGKIKIEREGAAIEIYEKLIGYYEERHASTEPLKSAIQILKTPLSLKAEKNEKSVGRFKCALEHIVSPVCDAAEQQDFNTAAKLLGTIISPEIPDWPEQPDNGYRGVNYCRGKVVEYCFGGDCAAKGVAIVNIGILVQNFVGKWVAIEPAEMTREEIWLLISTAWYLESEECRKKGMLDRKHVDWEVKLYNDNGVESCCGGVV